MSEETSGTTAGVGDVDWRRLLTSVAAAMPGDLVDEVAASLAAVEGADIWVWDVQRRTVGSLGTGARARLDQLIDRSTVVRDLVHLGSSVGFLTLTDASAAVDEPTLDAVAALIAMALAAGSSAGDTVKRASRSEEMSLAAELQWSLLPATERRLGGLDLTAAVEPAYDTGGDIFDHALDGTSLFLGVLDARGHGLRAATTSAVAASAMRRARRLGSDLVGIAADIDTAIGAINQEDFVSAVLVELDLSTWTGTWLTAGHRPPLILSSDGVEELPMAPALPLGMTIDGDRSEPTLQRLEVSPGDTLVLYSDGIVENIDADTDQMIGDLEFQRTLLDVRQRTSAHAHLAREVVEALLSRTGARIRDDATLLTARRAD